MFQGQKEELALLVNWGYVENGVPRERGAQVVMAGTQVLEAGLGL